MGWEDENGEPGGVGDGNGGEGEFACAVLLGDDFAERGGEGTFVGEDGAGREQGV